MNIVHVQVFTINVLFIIMSYLLIIINYFYYSTDSTRFYWLGGVGLAICAMFVEDSCIWCAAGFAMYRGLCIEGSI